MQAIEMHLESDRHVDGSARSQKIREMQDALSRYLPRFHRNAYRDLGNAADAEDCLSKVEISDVRSIPLDSLNGRGNSTQNILPSPNSLTSPISPPINKTS